MFPAVAARKSTGKEDGEHESGMGKLTKGSVCAKEGRRGFVGNGAERRFVGGGARRRSDEGVEGSWAKKVPGEVAKAVECLT